MWRVLIDAERLRQVNSGLGQVALNLGRQFLAHPSPRWTPAFILPDDRRDQFDTPIDAIAPDWRLRYAPWAAPRFDLWHLLHQDTRFVPPRGTPYVLTIHDLNFLGEKSPAKARRRLKRVQKLVDRASAITVISEFTRDMIGEHLDTGNTPVDVIYNGLCTDPGLMGQSVDGMPDGDFLFALGVIRPKKNFHVLVDFLGRLEDINLVIAGNTKGPYAEQIRRQASERGLAERLFIAGEIDDAQKAWLFRHCTAFVFPSLHEGFGLPLVEAMSFGKPAFCAARTSLPEIGGDEVYYWHDFDPDNMAATYRGGMQAFTADPHSAERLRARAAQFSWENAAEKYAAVYERALSGS